MQRILSTYRFVNQPLGPGLIAEIAQAGFSAIEIFCSQQHFDYRDPQAVQRALAACAHRARYFAGARKRSADFNF
jgi:sugar phosphate isomerase/epimerase